MDKDGIYIYRQSAAKGNLKVIIGFCILFVLLGRFLYSVGANWQLLFVIAVPFIILFVKEKWLIIDFENRKFKDIHSFLGIRVGRWRPLPAIDYISVKRATNVEGLPMWGNSNVETVVLEDKIYEVNFILKNRQFFNVWSGKDENEAFKAAGFLGEKLNLRILDAIEKPFVWLDEQ